MRSPKISIVIPSYNKGKRIKETLESIFNQNYSNIEVIIMDGDSVDETFTIVKTFIKKYPDLISWVSEKDDGQLDAVNRGIEKATGDIVTFINADDIYEKDAFNLVSSYFIENPNALWFAGRSKVIDGNGKEIAKFVTWYKDFLFSFNSYQLLLMANYLMQPSIFLTRDIYKKYGPFTGTKKFITEYELWLNIGKTRMPFTTHKVLSKFRIEPTTITKTLSSELLIEDYKIVKKYTDNKSILFLHSLHNFARMLIGRFI